MERQAGLGRSLNEVIDSLTPAEPDAPQIAPQSRGTDLHDITPQLYRLVLEVQHLRERVDHLETENGNGAANNKPANNKAAKKKSKKQRNARDGKKTKKS
ncbi:MAG TPA: hypothetical protein VFZ17_09630 [Acidimicrobiia bacterium]|nr:hypothetical protein [Acidimicrobiia bacterium]